MIVSVEELQKNISLLNNIQEPIIVIDKRSNKKIAKIEPIKNNDLDLFNELIKDDIKVDTNIKGNFENVYIEHIEDYELSKIVKDRIPYNENELIEVNIKQL